MQDQIKVLVVDDEELIRLNFSCCLEDAGYQVVTAADGVEGLALFSSEQPDVVLTDLNMPKMDGIAFIEQARLINADIPLIVISGAGTVHDAIEAIRRGAWDYLTKPVQHPDEFTHVINRNLQRARLNIESRNHHQRLEEMVAVRTHELHLLNQSLEERIESAIAELRKKDNLLIQQSRLAAMGELLNSIAHQWRQPLNNIAVYIQTMQYLNSIGELTQEEIDHDIKAVMDILLYMSQTIDDFRSFFVKDRSKREFVLQEVVEKTLHLTKSAFIDKNITVSLEADPDVCATGYPNEYAQALLNILYNARDALLERAVAVPRIEITIKRTEGRSLVTVQDNGGGIVAEVMPRIFEPYFSTKGPSQGTGIGLYMAKTIIEHNMGGKLTASNTGTGAEFSIEL